MAGEPFILLDDARAYSDAVADDAVILANGDTRTKDEYWKELSGNTRPFATKVRTVDVAPLNAKVTGDKAVVNGRVTFRFPDGARELVDAFLFTDTWERRQGKLAEGAQPERREHKTRSAASGREDHAFGQQLPHEAAAPGT